MTHRSDRTSPAAWTGAHAGRRASPLPPGFDELARLAADLLEAPLASIVLSDCSESWYSSGALRLRGLPDDPFLKHTLSAPDVVEVRDSAADPRFAGLEGDLHAAGIRSYAGCALRAGPGSEVLGAIAIYRTGTVALAARERGILVALARQGAMLAGLHSRVTELELLSSTEHDAIAAAPSRAFALADSLLDSAPLAIYYADAQNEATYVNPEYRRMFRLAPTQSVDDWPNAVHPDDRARMEQLWADFLRRPQASRFEYRALGDAGAVRHYAERVAPTEGISGYVGTISDITDLVNTRLLLETVISDLPVALVACDAAGRITHHNRAALELYCADPAADGRIAGFFLMDGVTPLPRGEFPLERALRGETLTNLELVIVPPGAAPRSTLSSVRRLAGPDGQTLGAVAVIQDTTERKRRESELERVHRELVTASREAGMAEVATNVLHNVGNILNSVNISANLVAERIKQSKAAGVSRLAALLTEHAGGVGRFLADDARGRRVPEYLTTLGDQLLADQREALSELALLRDNLEHIKDTVMMQQSYAKLCGVAETVEVAALVEDSLRLNAGAFVRHGVQIKREMSVVPPIAVDKHKVLQILVNLVRNAKYACDESGRPDKLITLRVEPSARGARISVIDNGVGIPAENLHRLFRHGFTTFKSGHGFGLHSGALAARELGGTLRAESAGPGSGAAFILDLPLTPP
ncbi:MAG TPA: PAS domain-containing protein [Steroidobacteraceae bacterium]|jgi:PAS domain S-box-containing protein|nr:PAS domain-containing protein [Steroidobacteraceae bacterium]